MKILIIGGTLFLGRHLTEIALKRGHQITLFNRGNHKENIPKEVNFIQGNRKNIPTFPKDTFWDAVIDTSGYLPEDVAKAAKFFASKTNKYIFISSVSVYDDFSKSGLNENDSVAKLEDENNREITEETYGALKALCEDEVRNFFPNNYLNIRPGLIVGAYDFTDRFTYWPVKIRNGGEIVISDYDLHQVQYIDASDLSEFIIHSIENNKSGTFNVVGPDYHLIFKEVKDICINYAQKNISFKIIPQNFLETQLLKLNTYLPLLKPPNNLKGIDEVDSSKAIASGLKFRKLDDTIKDLLNWFDTLPKNYKLRVGLTKSQEKIIINNFKDKE